VWDLLKFKILESSFAYMGTRSYGERLSLLLVGSRAFFVSANLDTQQLFQRPEILKKKLQKYFLKKKPLFLMD